MFASPTLALEAQRMLSLSRFSTTLSLLSLLASLSLSCGVTSLFTTPFLALATVLFNLKLSASLSHSTVSAAKTVSGYYLSTSQAEYLMQGSRRVPDQDKDLASTASALSIFWVGTLLLTITTSELVLSFLRSWRRPHWAAHAGPTGNSGIAFGGEETLPWTWKYLPKVEALLSSVQFCVLVTISYSLGTLRRGMVEEMMGFGVM